MAHQRDRLSGADSSNDPAAPTHQFTLRTLLWAIGLLALILAPIANFGAQAIAPSLYIACVIALLIKLYRSEPKPALRWLLVLSVAILAGVSGSILLPAIGSYDVPPHHRCGNSVRQMRVALDYYAKNHSGQYPSASIAGPDGRPWHSWRTQLLPYLGEQAFYDSYSWLEPWNGPNNRRLAQYWPKPICCSLEHKPPHTSTFVLVTGPGSAWGDGPPPTLSQLEKLPELTILMLEVKNTGIHWMEPRDLTIDQIMNIVDTTGLASIAPHEFTMVALCARGYVDQIDLTIDRESLLQRLTADDD
jgi:hypothetical protein